VGISWGRWSTGAVTIISAYHLYSRLYQGQFKKKRTLNQGGHDVAQKALEAKLAAMEKELARLGNINPRKDPEFMH
jgi:hypothetical protein